MGYQGDYSHASPQGPWTPDTGAAPPTSPPPPPHYGAAPAQNGAPHGYGSAGVPQTANPASAPASGYQGPQDEYPLQSPPPAPVFPQQQPAPQAYTGQESSPRWEQSLPANQQSYPQAPYQPGPAQPPQQPAQQFPQQQAVPQFQQQPVPPQAPGQPQPQYYANPQQQQLYAAPPAPPQQQQPYAQPAYPQQQFPQAPYPQAPYPQAPYPQAPYPQAPYPQPQPPSQQPPYQQQPGQFPGAPVQPTWPVQPGPGQPGAAPAGGGEPEVTERFDQICAPFMGPGEQALYGTLLKLDSTIEETPDQLKVRVEGQSQGFLHGLAQVDKAGRKVNRGLKAMLSPTDYLTERLAEKGTEALNRKLAGPVFTGGWESPAGHLIRAARACDEDYGPGAYIVVTTHRVLVLRAPRLSGSATLAFDLSRGMIAGVRLESMKEALKHGRTPRAELHFADGSMAALMMSTKAGQRFATALGYPA